MLNYVTTVSIETVVFCDKKYYNENNLRMLQLFSKEYLYVKGNDLLRVHEGGGFISLYSDAQR